MKSMPISNEIRTGDGLGYKSSDKYMWTPCIDCGKKRWVRFLHNKPVNPRCSRCSKIGELGPNWRGGRTRTSDGYIRIKLKTDDFFYSMAHKDGTILEHRIIMARHLNRCLLPWEVVHHKNGVGDDNGIGNLELLQGKKHHLVDTAIKSYIASLESRIKELEEQIKREKV